MPRIGLDALDQLEARHAGQPEVEHDTVVRRLRQRLQRTFARRHRGGLDIAITDQVGDRLALHRIVLDDEQLLDALLDELADVAQPRQQILLRDRLVQEAERVGRAKSRGEGGGDDADRPDEGKTA
jgi:hypothetical protein